MLIVDVLTFYILSIVFLMGKVQDRS